MDKPTFEIHIDELGKYRFRVRATNNRIVTFGEGCNTLNDCMNGIMDVKEIIEEYHESTIIDFTKGETTLILEKPKNSIEIGSTITFSGRLFGHTTGEGIKDAKISIFETDGTILKETPIAHGYTNSLGGFYIDWVVKKMDWWDHTIEVMAKFEGEQTAKPSSSKKIKLMLS
jgi:uncharacterized protein YegP (UPF0339 family)